MKEVLLNYQIQVFQMLQLYWWVFRKGLLPCSLDFTEIDYALAGLL